MTVHSKTPIMALAGIPAAQLLYPQYNDHVLSPDCSYPMEAKVLYHVIDVCA